MSGTIIVAPFSNSDIRDWPADYYARLIGMLLERWDGLVRVIGTRSQALRANDIVRQHDARRVVNECGVLAWEAVIEEIGRAECVIGNNSGIAHLAGSLGVPTVCVFGGSHQRLEWRPLGATVTTLTRSIGCSPCHLDHKSNCPYDKSCLRQIIPETVADAVIERIAIGRGPIREAA